MNLVEGELIEEIEELGEGWCSGVGGNGAKSGLFPSESETETPSGWFHVLPTSQLRRVNRASG